MPFSSLNIKGALQKRFTEFSTMNLWDDRSTLNVFSETIASGVTKKRISTETGSSVWDYFHGIFHFGSGAELLLL